MLLYRLCLWVKPTVHLSGLVRSCLQSLQSVYQIQHSIVPVCKAQGLVIQVDAVGDKQE